MIQILAIIFAFISALILISLDIPLSGKYLDIWLFGSLNNGLLRLKRFEDTPLKGPRRSIMQENEKGFSSLLIIFKNYFPEILHKYQRQKIIQIVCESALAMSTKGEESMLDPVCIWFKGEERLTSLCSLNELRILIKDYKQRILNRWGLFFLFLSLVLQIISL